MAWGPFLIVVPLSTLGNWVTEFSRFTPTIPTLLYHGSIAERDTLRRKHLTKLESQRFPIVTSYELAMNDRRYFQPIRWKYLIVDEGHRL